MSDSDTASDVSADQVIAYLRNHPNFFKTHPNLITELNFSHDTGGAVSLIQRQVELLREHHKKNREKLAQLAGFAKTNEALLERIQILSIASAKTNSAPDALEAVAKVIINRFGLDETLLLVPHGNWQGAETHVVQLPPEELGNIRNAVYNLNVFVGRPPAKIRDGALSNFHETCSSIAMARFKYRSEDAYLVVGSRDPEHFN